MRLNEWKNIESVLNWFKNIPKIYKYYFIPSVKERLLSEFIRFAKCYISITNKDTEETCHARKSLLYYNNNLWAEKGGRNGRIRWV